MAYDLIKAAARARAARSAKNATKEFIHQRFWAMVKKSDKDECWIWTGPRFTSGYGIFGIRTKKMGAHRFAYAESFGKIPKGMYICHHCDNPPCVNPGHLFLGTPKDNSSDCIKKGRFKSSCGEKHPMHKLTDSDVAEMRKMYESGLNCRVIGRKFGVGKVCAAYAIFGQGWTHIPGAVKPRDTKGRNHPSVKLTEEQVREIRARYVPWVVTMQKLADKYGVNHTNIYAIIHRKSWPNLM